MSRNELSQAKGAGGTGPSLLWFLLGGGAGVGLYYLLKPYLQAPPGGPGRTEVMAVPSLFPPSSYSDLAAVSARFGEVRDLYHTGRLTPDQAIAQIDQMTQAAGALAAQGRADASAAQKLVADLSDFRGQILDFVKFQRSLAQPAAPVGMEGIRRIR